MFAYRLPIFVPQIVSLGGVTGPIFWLQNILVAMGREFNWEHDFVFWVH